ncbi:MAG: nicotinate phosphoribosyltransferase [Acidimicrobiia bacterium]|nr:nicotinate phosphoribosyltransferase [Acidimicrobiia bacterium]NNF62735.1 nicotinate phosphoribosyltransferase [Acidimicrobiia bacterium]
MLTALTTDLYQLTMAQVYYRRGLHERPAQFDHFFRSYPDYGSHQAGYCVAAGLEAFVGFVADTAFTDDDIAYLSSLKGRSGSALFAADFLRWLRSMSFTDGITIEAVLEGRVVHANAPMTVVTGPLATAQILETALLNQINYATLIATKASRMVDSARGRPVLEFGLRRGATGAGDVGARAALIGGAEFTSNVSAARDAEVEPKGTHAHSLVQAMMALGEGERGAFQAYADVYPDDCVLLVDTIDTLESGVPNAIEVFEDLRSKGHEPVGIRLDSGDLAYLAVRSARMLDDAGFEGASIVLSGGLDEMSIWQILTQIDREAARYGLDPVALVDRLTFGVGTSLITSEGDPALDGVYKLVAISDGSAWQPAIKISENPMKVPNPGRKALHRLYDNRGIATADVMSLEGEVADDPMVLRHPIEATLLRSVSPDSLSGREVLLEVVVDEGDVRAEFPGVDELRKRRERDLDRLDEGVRRLVNPHIYHVSLSERLWDLKQALVASPS